MKSIFPNKLKIGDTICVIAPAISVAACKPKSIINTSKKRMKDLLGLEVVFSKNVLEKNMLGSSSIKSRIKDLHDSFLDKNIKGISCALGGFNANELLSYIDWNIIKNNPKPIWGYSDITVLTNAFYAKTGLVSYHGPNFVTMGKKEEEYIFEYIFNNLKKCLMSDDSFEVIPSKYWKERKTKEKPKGKPNKNTGPIVLQNGNTIGVIIGGNLCSLNLLQGTDFMPSLKDKVLFIEDDDFGGKLSPLEFSRNLESLLQCKDANTIKGIVFGRFQKGFNMDLKKMKLILESKKISKNIPIIYNVDFGHTTPMITFPIGGTVKIEANNKKINIEILKH